MILQRNIVIHKMGNYYYGENPTNYLPFNTLHTTNYFFYPSIVNKNWGKKTDTKLLPNLLSKLNDQLNKYTKSLRIYIHVPYCKSFCYYCSYNRKSYPKQKYEDFENYVNYLIKELDYYLSLPYIKNKVIDTIQIGGGSPSTLPTKLLKKLFSYLKENVPNYRDASKTFTGEPRTLNNIELLELIKTYQYDRLSFGVESFNDHTRKQIGRLSTREDIETVIHSLKKIDYSGEVNTDIMLNLPGQTFNDFKKELTTLIDEFNPVSIDAFSTHYIPTAPLLHLIADGKRDQPANIWELLKMREFVHDFSLSRNYSQLTSIQYSKIKEISSFHKGNYDVGDTIPIGLGALGIINNFRITNPATIEEWMMNIDTNRVSAEIFQLLTDEQQITKEMVMFPRTLKISKHLIYKYEHTKAFKKFLNSLKNHVSIGVIDEHRESYTVNKLGTIWFPNLQYDYIKHDLNIKGKFLHRYTSSHQNNFSNNKRIRHHFLFRIYRNTRSIK